MNRFTLSGAAVRGGMGGLLLWMLVGTALPGPLSAVVAATVPQEIQTLYDKKQYQQALDEIAKIDKDRAAAPDVRRVKIRSLLKLGNPKDALPIYDQLVASLKQEDEALLHDVALGFIVVLMKDMREQMRGAAYTALKETSSDEVIPYFEDGLSDGSGPVRVLAVEGLSRSEAGRKSQKLRSALEDQAAVVKARAVKAIGQSGDPSMLPLIETATKDEMATGRIAAYGALIRLGRKEAWDSLRKAAEAPNPEDRADALRVIAELKDQRAVPLMTELLSYKQPSVRGAAARALGHLGRKELRAQLEALLKDPVQAVREAAAASLADLGGKESVSALTKALSDGAFTVRASAVAALLQLGEPFQGVAPIVLALAQHNDTAARASAAYALGKATKPNAGDAAAVLESLTADPLPGPKIVALRSLGRIGTRDSIPLFKEALHDTNEAVRATAGGGILHLLDGRKPSRS
jgi:HEAT repeat protein